MRIVTQISLLIVAFLVAFGSSRLSAQVSPSKEGRSKERPSQEGATTEDSSESIGSTVDSLHVARLDTDSLLKADSILIAGMIEHERKLDEAPVFASQREIDLTNDGKPEVLRISGRVARHVDDTKLEFSIRSGHRTLFRDSWSARGYFDTIDHLPDSIKRRRLRRLVTVFFANENFSVLDSTEFRDLIHEGSSADVAPKSSEAAELFSKPRVMYAVYHDRDYWYGLVWLPSKHRFVRAWRN